MGGGPGLSRGSKICHSDVGTVLLRLGWMLSTRRRWNTTSVFWRTPWQITIYLIPQHNVEESGVPFDPNPPNIVAKNGSKKVRYRTSGKKRQVTIVGCANAAGQVLPPIIIFDVKKINDAWTKDEDPGNKIW